jgi:hypothetical protein
VIIFIAGAILALAPTQVADLKVLLLNLAGQKN